MLTEHRLRPVDVAETQAVKSVCSDHAYKLAMSSTKIYGRSMHLVRQVEWRLFLLRWRFMIKLLHPTINYTTPDPDCDLDYVPNEARKMNIDVALSNSFGFGGTNGIISFQKKYSYHFC